MLKHPEIPLIWEVPLAGFLLERAPLPARAALIWRGHGAPMEIRLFNLRGLRDHSQTAAALWLKPVNNTDPPADRQVVMVQTDRLSWFRQTGCPASDRQERICRPGSVPLRVLSLLSNQLLELGDKLLKGVLLTW